MKRLLGKIVLAGLSAFGLNACSILDIPMAEYGCPYADFELSGTVVDSDSAKAIPGIEVTYQGGTAYSDETGAWKIVQRGAPFPKLLIVYADDIDGDANRGMFARDSTGIDPEREPDPLPWHDKWYSGRYIQNDIVITLKKAPTRRTE
jgi:putative lipoprotein (rSAM/lipoprotein system)